MAVDSSMTLKMPEKARNPAKKYIMFLFPDIYFFIITLYGPTIQRIQYFFLPYLLLKRIQRLLDIEVQ
ncbi:MAG: hypothetical protein PF447_13010, partial [Spirochaetaceae bacterium]|nr:hypothetical protein [Spirochaetaceae bacterium]